MNMNMSSALTLLFALSSTALMSQDAPKPANTEYPDFYTGENAKSLKGIDFVQSIDVKSPAYCSEIKGDVTVTFKAPGMTEVKAMCWQQPTKEDPNTWGHDANLAPDLKLDAEGNGSFVFHADQFPNGPITIRIYTKNAKKQDICELQLFNKGGVVWNQGIPKAQPPGAKGMKLVYEDDFNAPLSISPDGMNAKYPCHKTGGGDFSGWQFSNPSEDNKIFEQAGTFMRIHASKKPGTNGSSGIISSIRSDGTGVSASVPSYFECRFVCHSAPGSWPAFWTLTKGTIGMDRNDPEYAAVSKAGCDELDIIEGYGGYGRGNPNSGGVYCIVTHYWSQPKPEWAKEKGPDGKPNPEFKKTNTAPDTLKYGGKSSWSWTFHTYGVLITETDTVYYFDDFEVLRHPTGPVSKSQPAWFLINYAVGGISGWKIDMNRYGNQSDMWVDWVRVWSGRVTAPVAAPGRAFIFDKPAELKLACGTEDASIRYTIDGSEPTDKSQLYQKPLSFDKPCMVKAAAFCEGLKPSPICSAEIAKARSPENPANTVAGLKRSYYEGKWEFLPDFGKLTPLSKETANIIEIAGNKKQENFGLLFEGFINVPADGIYTFYTNSDDGSRLLIGNKIIVDNDGGHAMQERSGTVGLLAGKHQIRIEFCQGVGGKGLEVSWSGPGVNKQIIPAEVLSCPGE